MDLDNLRLFLAVVEHGALQTASKRLGIARSTLRRRLDELEASVGQPLLVTGSSGVELTHAGAVVLEEGRALLERSARMLAAARAPVQGLEGWLRLCVPVGFSVPARLMMIAQLREACPGIRLEVQEQIDPLDHLHEGFDLVLHHGAPPDRSAWFSRVLHRVPLRVIAADAYLQEHGTPASLDELKDHVLLGWRRPGVAPDRWPFLHRGGDALRIEPAFISDNTELLHAAVRAGHGVLLGASDPRFHLEGATALTTLFDDEIGDELSLRVLTPSPSSSSPLVRAVLEQIHQLIGSAGGDQDPVTR